jgi:hypothetical protein
MEGKFMADHEKAHYGFLFAAHSVMSKQAHMLHSEVLCS